MDATFPTLEKPNRSRPFLLAEFARVIVGLDSPVPQRCSTAPRYKEVASATAVLPTHIASFVLRLKQLGIMQPEEQVQIVRTVGEVVDQLVVE